MIIYRHNILTKFKLSKSQLSYNLIYAQCQDININGKIIVPNYLIHQVYCLRHYPFFTYIQGEDFLT